MTALTKRKRAKSAPCHSPVFWMLVGIGGTGAALALAGYLWRRAWGITPTPTVSETTSP